MADRFAAISVLWPPMPNSHYRPDTCHCLVWNSEYLYALWPERRRTAGWRSSSGHGEDQSELHIAALQPLVGLCGPLERQ